MDNITVALTLRNRASFLDDHLHFLTNYVDYDMKKVEICITDGYSTDNLFEIIEKWYSKFYQIKYAISDRSVLPFKIPSNNPACDINAMICNVVTFEKIIKTDAECLPPTNMFKRADEVLNDKDALLWYPNACMQQGQIYNRKASRVDGPVFYNGLGGLLHAFNKSTFIEMNGIEEKFALGFAFEDTQFLYHWRDNKKLVQVSFNEEGVIHFWHGYEQSTAFNMNLWHTYSEPLCNYMVAHNIHPNVGNPDWKRPEMIKDVKIFKDTI